jgi:hypothetical protein
MNTNRFVWLLSHDEVNQYLAPNLGAAHDLIVQPRWLKEGPPDGDCQALVVDLDSVAPGRLALQRLVKELRARSRPYPVAVFGYSLEDDQILELRAAGIHVFHHGLCPAVFAAIADLRAELSRNGPVVVVGRLIRRSPRSGEKNGRPWTIVTYEVQGGNGADADSIAALLAWRQTMTLQ